MADVTAPERIADDFAALRRLAPELDALRRMLRLWGEPVDVLTVSKTTSGEIELTADVGTLAQILDVRSASGRPWTGKPRRTPQADALIGAAMDRLMIAFPPDRGLSFELGYLGEGFVAASYAAAPGRWQTHAERTGPVRCPISAQRMPETLRTALRDIARTIAPGSVAMVYVPDGERARMSAHERLDYEARRSSLSGTAAHALRTLAAARCLRLRRCGDVALLIDGHAIDDELAVVGAIDLSGS